MSAPDNCKCPVSFNGRKSHSVNCPWKRPIKKDGNGFGGAPTGSMPPCP